MKYGVLRFGYQQFSTFEKTLRAKGFYSVNIGDNMQTIAVRRLYKLIGITPEDIVYINRDDLASYKGEQVLLVMNACFYKRSFPLPPNIKPIFVGFQTNEETVQSFAELFKMHEPIGCRDINTTMLMEKYGVKAFTSGCLTLAMRRRSNEIVGDRVYVVHGSGSGALPAGILEHMPSDLIAKAEFVNQRMIVDTLPLTARHMLTAERVASSLLAEYQRKAFLVVTPLHHAASPCIAAGIPVVICRKAADTRFSFLSTLLPVYTPETFGSINWRPAPVEIEGLKAELMETVRRKIFEIGKRDTP